MLAEKCTRVKGECNLQPKVDWTELLAESMIALEIARDCIGRMQVSAKFLQANI